MNFISSLVPLNYLEEKDKFFADPDYNPQFTYENDIPKTKLMEYGLPQESYLDQAKKVLKKTYFGSNESELFMHEGPLLSQSEVEERIHTFLELNHLADRYTIVWSSSFVSRATITADTLKLRLPVDFRRDGLIGMIYHELGTHALRRINYEKQSWFKKKKANGFEDYLRTEEGLAAIHALLPHKHKSAYISAIRYVAIEYAQHHSFSALWRYLGSYIQDPERRWNVTFREKRGLTDTSRPGGYTKDLVYFEGLVDMCFWLLDNDFDVQGLYYGKISARDVDKARQLSPHFEPVLPNFFVHDLDGYQKNIREIIEYNEFRMPTV